MYYTQYNQLTDFETEYVFCKDNAELELLLPEKKAELQQLKLCISSASLCK